jgi:hypothetical protein
LLRCSLEIEALCRRCQLAEKRSRGQRLRHSQSENSGLGPKRNTRAHRKVDKDEASL